MITIDGKSYPTSRPADLDDILIARTGCDAAETRAMLSVAAQASHLAKALHPFLSDKDAPAEPDLAVQIAAVEDRSDIVAQILALYDKALHLPSVDKAAPAKAAPENAK